MNFKKFSNIFVIIMIVAMIFSLSACNKNENIPKTLYFNENGEFTVIHLADLHEWIYDETEKKMRNDLVDVNKNFLLEILNDIKPDLVVLGGDNLFPLNGTLTDRPKKMGLKTIDLIAKYFNETKVFWTLVFGNHDDEGGYDKEELLKQAMESPYFVGGLNDSEYYQAYQDKKEDKVGNYLIPIRSFDDTKIAYNVLCLDSGSARVNKSYYDNKENGTYNWIKESQVEWYINASNKAKENNNGNIVPAIAFMHIPLHEHRSYFNAWNDPSMVIDWTGDRGGYATSKERDNFFENAVVQGDVRGIFAGHDHAANYTALCKTDNQNIILSSTRQWGRWNNNLPFGRVIVLKENGGFYTYEYSLENKQENILTYQ